MGPSRSLVEAQLAGTRAAALIARSIRSGTFEVTPAWCRNALIATTNGSRPAVLDGYARWRIVALNETGVVDAHAVNATLPVTSFTPKVAAACAAGGAGVDEGRLLNRWLYRSVGINIEIVYRVFRVDDRFLYRAVGIDNGFGVGFDNGLKRAPRNNAGLPLAAAGARGLTCAMQGDFGQRDPSQCEKSSSSNISVHDVLLLVRDTGSLARSIASTSRAHGDEQTSLSRSVA